MVKSMVLEPCPTDVVIPLLLVDAVRTSLPLVAVAARSPVRFGSGFGTFVCVLINNKYNMFYKPRFSNDMRYKEYLIVFKF